MLQWFFSYPNELCGAGALKQLKIFLSDKQRYLCLLKSNDEAAVPLHLKVNNGI